MGYECRVEADSVTRAHLGSIRLLSFVVRFPRKVLAETVTHRINYESTEALFFDRTAPRELDKSSASSRAIPVEKMIAAVLEDPYIPERFSKNQKGMHDSAWLEGKEHERAVIAWLEARDMMVEQARELMEVGAHKQEANRLLEPFAWVTQIITATEWPNFFYLRCHATAEPAFRKIARMMYRASQASTPKLLEVGEWHLPFTTAEEWLEAHNGGSVRLATWKEISAGRCARVSYLSHDGKRDPEEDIRLAARLRESRPVHASPFGHQGTPLEEGDLERDPWKRSNLRGYLQYRKEIAFERCDSYEPGPAELATWDD